MPNYRVEVRDQDDHIEATHEWHMADDTTAIHKLRISRDRTYRNHPNHSFSFHLFREGQEEALEVLTSFSGSDVMEEKSR